MHPMHLDLNDIIPFVRVNDNNNMSAELSPLHACMIHVYVQHSSLHCVCLFNIRNIFGTTYPAPEHGYGTVQVCSESVHDLGVG